VIRQLDPSHPVWIANLNCPGQIVIAGSVSALDLAAEALKRGGAKRILPLDVSGAFHSGLMRPAQDELAAKIAATSFHESPVAIVMNVSGDFVLSTEQIRQLLIDQLTSPVRWEKGVREMMKSGIDTYLEMGPGRTLAGMNKRIGVAEPTYSLEKSADLEELNKIMGLYATVEA
jgi:[acyl-carrier-protein] S-malonyltransferase